MEKLTKTSFKCPVKKKIRGIFATGIVFMSTLAVLIKTREWNSAVASFAVLTKTRQPKSLTPATTSLFSYLHQLNGIANMMMYWVINNIYTVSSAKKILELVEV